MAESLDMVYRFMALDGQAAAAFTGLSEKARVAATATGDLTAATLRSADAEKLAADAASRAAEMRLQASAALARAKELEVSGDAASAAAAREAADALALQARAAAATSRELNANALAAERQAGAIRAARAETGLHATSLRGLIGQATGVTSALEGIPTPVTIVAGALGKLAIGAGVAGAAVAALSIDFAEKFQTSMLRVHTQANQTMGTVAALSKGILSMAGSVATTPAALADAAYHIASVGQGSLTTAQQLNVLKIAAEGAKIGGADLTDVTNGLDAAIVSGIKGVRNYSQAMGALNATVGAGDMTMQDLADALGTGVLAVIKQYGVTLKQAGAALAVFGDNNIRGALAGNQLRMSVQALTKPSASASDALKALGLSSKDAFSHFAEDLQRGGLTLALTDLRHRLTEAGFTGGKVGKELTDAFGRRAGVGLSILIGQMERFHSKIREVGAGAGGFASSWQGYTKSFQFSLDQARGAAEAMLIQLGTHLLPEATKVLRWLGTDGVKDLDKFGAWFERNKQTIAHFAGISIGAFADLANAALEWGRITIDAADIAFGWVPVIGGKLDHAKTAFDHFASTTEGILTKMSNTVYHLGDDVGSNLTGGVVAGITTGEGYAVARAYKLGGDVGAAVKAGAKVKSPSETTTYVGRMLAEGLIHGWTGEAGRIKNILGTDVENALNALTSRVLSVLNRQKGILKAAQSRLHQDLASRRSDTASLASSIGGVADLSGAFTTDANGNTVLGNVAGFAQGQVASLQRFAQDLAAARKLGLNPADLMQIANMGADQGDQILRQLLSSGQIQALNAAQAQIAKYSGAAASTAENAAYAGTLSRDQKNVHEQTVELREIKRTLHAIERHAAADVARHVTITVDSKGKLKLTNEDGREIVRELRALAQKGIKP